MSEYFEHDGVALFHGDCMEVLKTLPTNSIHRVMTSPPYFGLRSYLPPGHPLKEQEIGSEPTVEVFIATMVAVFREVRRVLREDGVCFINLGDSYADDSKWGGSMGGKHVKGLHGNSGIGRRRRGTDCDPKRGDMANGQPKLPTENGQLANIPHRVAEALRADGWIWRQTIVWAKRSPMPESVSGWRWVRCKRKAGRIPADWAARPKGWQAGEGSHDAVAAGNYRQDEGQTVAVFEDCPGCAKCDKRGGYILRRGKGRCTTAHEYVFVFAKSDRYFWDSSASAELAVMNGGPRQSRTRGYFESKGTPLPGREPFRAVTETRNPRSVWTLSSEPTKVRHYATFPSELVRRCLISGPCTGGACSACGSPYAPVVESERIPTRPALNPKAWKHAEGDAVGQRSEVSPNLDPERHIAITKTIGYWPTCNCGAGKSRPVCLDPFNGIGTTGQTARELGYDYIGIDLNTEYLDESKTRIFETPRWKLRQQKKPARIQVTPGQIGLFAGGAA